MYSYMATNDIPKKEPERWAWIKYQLELKGYNFSRLGKELGVHKNTLTVVKSKSYPKSQKAIADKLIRLPQEIWPERYGSDGRPIKHSPRYPRKGITRCKRRQCLINKAV